MVFSQETSIISPPVQSTRDDILKTKISDKGFVPKFELFAHNENISEATTSKVIIKRCSMNHRS